MLNGTGICQMRIKTWRLLSRIRFVLLAIFVHVATSLSIEAETKPGAPNVDPAMGRLVIHGKAIEYLVLAKRTSNQRFDAANTIRLDRPEPNVAIPAGEYRVQEVQLQGGYRCVPPQAIGDPETVKTREVGWFTVSPDKPYVLAMGAPLKPTLKVYRVGHHLRMAYFLSDVSGQEFWNYTPQDFGCGPVASFSVYQSDQLVGSGSLAPES